MDLNPFVTDFPDIRPDVNVSGRSGQLPFYKDVGGFGLIDVDRAGDPVMEQSEVGSEGIVPSGYTVQWQNVGKKLRGKSVLDGVSLYIAEGEKVMICGRSGEGKSTILKMLPGLLTPDTGTACVGGVSVTEAQPKALREQTAFIPQEPYIGSWREKKPGD